MTGRSKPESLTGALKLYPFMGEHKCDEDGHENGPFISHGPEHVVCYICWLEHRVDELESLAGQAASVQEELDELYKISQELRSSILSHSREAWLVSKSMGCLDAALTDATRDAMQRAFDASQFFGCKRFEGGEETMSDRFDQVLEDASRRVSEWPEWRKSEALKQSEQLLKSTNTPTAHADENRGINQPCGFWRRAQYKQDDVFRAMKDSHPPSQSITESESSVPQVKIGANVAALRERLNTLRECEQAFDDADGTTRFDMWIDRMIHEAQERLKAALAEVKKDG